MSLPTAAQIFAFLCALSVVIGMVKFHCRKPTWQLRMTRRGERIFDRISAKERQALAFMRIGKVMVAGGACLFVIDLIRRIV